MRVYFAREKNELAINTYATSNRFFLFFTHTLTHACARNCRTTLRFKTCETFYQTYSHVGFPNLAPIRSESHFWTQNVDLPSSPDFESIGARTTNYFLELKMYLIIKKLIWRACTTTSI
jgi:hypothetical protein